LNYDKPIYQHTITLHNGEEIYRHGNTSEEAKEKAVGIVLPGNYGQK